MPVMQYIGRRKLLHAIHEIGCGGKGTDVALEYGAATPVNTVDGREFVEDGELYFVLTRRLQGQPIKAVEQL